MICIVEKDTQSMICIVGKDTRSMICIVGKDVRFVVNSFVNYSGPVCKFSKYAQGQFASLNVAYIVLCYIYIILYNLKFCCEMPTPKKTDNFWAKMFSVVNSN